MSEQPLAISQLNDFIFCPADSATYSTQKGMLQGISVYCEKYNLVGKIDVFDKKTGILTERKKKIKTVYDGYIYQIYAQYSLHLGLIIPNNFYCCRLKR